MILVTIPYFNAQDTIREAVKSVLKQTYKDFELLVITDGDSPTAEEVLKIKHPKLKFFNLEENHGRYFVDAVAVMANPYEFYSPHDADDTSYYNRFYHLVKKQRETEADAVFQYQKVHTRNGKVVHETYPLLNTELTPTMKHLAHHAALYKTETLRNVGSYHPDYRVGYDTLLVNLIAMTSEITVSPRLTYQRNQRDNSLTTSKETGFGSRHRYETLNKLKQLYRSCYRKPERIKSIVEKSVKPETAKAVKREAKRLKEEMGW